ncbi:hypothetical protein CRUP_038736 [Coryphaenoides rupestris]|nr:hypothetical protein CRUP_038736 [Coryphaenoides rupestris]
MTLPLRTTANRCSCSMRLCSPRNCFSLLQSLKAVTSTTHTTDSRMAAPSIHPASASPSSSAPLDTFPHAGEGEGEEGEAQGDYGGDLQDDECDVLQRLPHQLQEGLGLLGGDEVLTEDLVPSVQRPSVSPYDSWIFCRASPPRSSMRSLSSSTVTPNSPPAWFPSTCPPAARFPLGYDRTVVEVEVKVVEVVVVELTSALPGQAEQMYDRTVVEVEVKVVEVVVVESLSNAQAVSATGVRVQAWRFTKAFTDSK